MFRHQPRDRLALAALIAFHAVIDAERGELVDARQAAVLLQIGEDDDIGLRAERQQRLTRAGHQRLARHFGGEEALDQAPHLLARKPAAIPAPPHRLGEVAAGHREIDIVRFARENRNEIHLELQLGQRWSLEGTYGDARRGAADLIWTKTY